MKVTILDKKKNPVMEREEIVLLIEHEGASQPSRKEFRQVILPELGKKTDVVAVKKIQSIFGTPTSRVFVNVYKNAERKRYFEPKHVLKKEEKQNAQKEANPREEKSA